MYKKILIPVDGSKLSKDSAEQGIIFAKEKNAEIIILFIKQSFGSLLGFDGANAGYLRRSAITYEETMTIEAEKITNEVKELADGAGVKNKIIISSNFHPADGIIEVSENESCDLIFIPTHGRSGLKKLVLGSVASKVITLSKIPVLIHR